MSTLVACAVTWSDGTCVDWTSVPGAIVAVLLVLLGAMILFLAVATIAEWLS